MSRLALIIAASLGAIAIFAGVARAEEFNVGSVRLYNGTPCAPSQCQLSESSAYGSHTVVTGSSRAYLGSFYVWTDMSSPRYVSFNANAYINTTGLGYYMTLQARILCNGYYHFSQAKSFYEPGPSTAVYFGTLTMLSPC